MPRLVSPAEALQRLKEQQKSEGTETIGCRIPVDVFRRIAEHGERRQAKDMSTSLRIVLEEWYQTQKMEGGAGLGQFSTEELTTELARRGLQVVNQKKLIGKFRKTLKRAKERMDGVLDSLVSDRVINKLTADGPDGSKKSG